MMSAYQVGLAIAGFTVLVAVASALNYRRVLHFRALISEDALESDENPAEMAWRFVENGDAATAANVSKWIEAARLNRDGVAIREIANRTGLPVSEARVARVRPGDLAGPTGRWLIVRHAVVRATIAAILAVVAVATMDLLGRILPS